MKIEFKDIEEKQVAYIIMTGPFDQLPEIFSEVMNYAIGNNLQITEPPYCTFFNNTMEVPAEELHYEVGIPVIGDANRECRVKIKKIPAHQVVFTVYKGIYGQKTQVYQTLMEYAVKNGYLIAGPVTEICINYLVETLENKRLTEVLFPVIKK